MPQAKCLHDLMRIRACNRAYLESISKNLGTALGFKKRTGQELSKEPAIIVFVPHKINPKWIPNMQAIPPRLDGPDGLWCALDVVEGGKAEAEEKVEQGEDELCCRLRGWDEQIWAGSQIAHWLDEGGGSYSMGTIGAFARSRRDGALGLLTNQHVGVHAGQELYHPVPWATHVATTARVLEYVSEDNWYGQDCKEPNAYVRADCAFATLSPEIDRADLNPWLMGVGQLGPVKPIDLGDMSIIGQKVLRVGRTTGLRRGTIVAFSYEFLDEASQTGYTDLLIIGDDGIPFSTHGDSGSLIVADNAQFNPVGLLWGGWQEKLRPGYAQENWTWGISLGRILDALEIDLVTDAAELQVRERRHPQRRTTPIEPPQPAAP